MQFRPTKPTTAGISAIKTEPAIIVLSKSALGIEYTAHRDRQTLLSDFKLALEALTEIYAPVSAVRLGLRYVNVITRERVGADMKRPLAWTDLLTPKFAAVPGGLIEIDDETVFLSEISSPYGRGSMTVRYGILRDAADKTRHFRLDTDRFLDGAFQTAEVLDLLDGFSYDIFQVFSTVAGESLLEWMRLEGSPSS